MANIVIRDLELNQELDKKALDNLSGGWGWPSIKAIKRYAGFVYKRRKPIYKAYKWLKGLW